MGTLHDTVWLESEPEMDWWMPEQVCYEGDAHFTMVGSRRYSVRERFLDFRKPAEGCDSLQLPPYITLSRALDQIFFDVDTEKIDKAIISAYEGKYVRMNTLNNNGLLEPLISWIKENGPLGLLLHYTKSLVHPPIWKKREGVMTAATAVDMWIAGKGWQRYWHQEAKENEPRIGREGSLVYADDSPQDIIADSDKGTQALSAVERYIQGANIEFFHGKGEPFEFFSSSPPSTYKLDIYPQPLSDGFFGLYEEPVHLFIAAANALCVAVRLAVSQDEDDKGAGLLQLRHLAAPASFSPEKSPRSGTFQISFSAPSLLSALACWAIIDLVEPQKVFLCAQCGKLHASPQSRTRFCSPSCRKLNATQRFRAKKKAQALLEAGKTTKEIASLMSRSEEEIEGMLDER